jgi:hypothetical protein
MINFESVNKEVFHCHLNVYTITKHAFLYLSLWIKNSQNFSQQKQLSNYIWN